MVTLGVNIDHVATLRQARQGLEPDPIQAAYIAEQAGADQITVHLREDRRHIQDRDVRLLRQTIQTEMNLEMALNSEIIAIACEIKPERVTIVPEKREEVTTEGGLQLFVPGFAAKLQLLQESGITISLFIEPDIATVREAARLGANAVEFHTGKYANVFGSVLEDFEVNRIEAAAHEAKKLGLHVAAGHGINYHNLHRLTALRIIEEYNIGHSIMARAIWVGLAEAVASMKKSIMQS